MLVRGMAGRWANRRLSQAATFREIRNIGGLKR